MLIKRVAAGDLGELFVVGFDEERFVRQGLHEYLLGGVDNDFGTATVEFCHDACVDVFRGAFRHAAREDDEVARLDSFKFVEELLERIVVDRCAACVDGRLHVAFDVDIGAL